MSLFFSISGKTESDYFLFVSSMQRGSTALKPGQKTGHADLDFVREVIPTLMALFQCSEEDLLTEFVFHNARSTCGRRSDGSFCIHAVTKVGIQDAARAWFGACSMSLYHCRASECTGFKF